MKCIGRIFRQDLKSLSKNLIIFAVVIGITVLPALYAWFNIAANWEPYSNTGEIPFAVCSLDKGYSYKGVKINAGEKIIDNLKQNDKMGWEFVENEEATEGVENGKYYASVIIPENFSENLLSLVTGEFKQAKLQYYVNEKINAIAPKITDKGVSAIQESIDATYVSTIAETIASTLNITNEELESGKENLSEKIISALETAKTETDSAKESIDLLIATLDSIDSLIKSNQEMLPSIEDTLSKAGVVAGDIKSTLKAAQETAAQLTSTIEELVSNGNTYVENVSAQLDEAFGTVSDDADAIANKFVRIKTINEKKIAVNNRLLSIFEGIEKRLGIKCTKVINRLNKANEKQQKIIDKVVEISDNIKSTGAFPKNAKAELEQLIDEADAELAGVESEFSGIKQDIDNALNNSFDSLDKVADFAQGINLEDGQLNGAFKAGSESITNLKAVLNNLKEYLDNLKIKIDKSIGRIDEIKSDDSIENLILPIIEDPEALGEFISAPVSYDTNKIYPIENYGSAMTPFYSSLALWVGGIVLVAVMNVDLTENDRKKLGKANSTQLFFGRYLMFFIIGQIQALIIALGDLYFLKIQCENPTLFILTCMLSSLVYTLFIYSLTITFSVVGKALAVIILVIQIAGAGGTFPIEVLPGPFKALSPFLPFKYGTNALRETVGGVRMDSYLNFIGILALFIIPSLLLGLLLRKPCIKIIAFFNHKIEESDLII